MSLRLACMPSLAAAISFSTTATTRHHSVLLQSQGATTKYSRHRFSLYAINQNDELQEEEEDSPSLFLSENLSRRHTLFLGVGGVFYGTFIGSTLFKLGQRANGMYPIDHEKRIAATFRRALVEAAATSLANRKPYLRVLEVGIGSSCRSVIKGLYDDALADLKTMGIQRVDLVGVDLNLPNSGIVSKATKKLNKSSIPVLSFQVFQGDVTSTLHFSDGYFDTVLCSYVLCSVSDQERAVREIKRVLHGTFGYVEHVAVDEHETYKLLEFEQKLLDPLQQIVAHNCHLRRDTEAMIRKIFEISTHGNDDTNNKMLVSERFLVDEMWPVSCQCRGVLQTHRIHDSHSLVDQRISFG